MPHRVYLFVLLLLFFCVPSNLAATSNLSTVEFRIHLNQLSNINEKDQTFDADFYLWITRNQDDTNQPQFEIINATSYSTDAGEDLIWEATLDGRLETSMRIKGTFSSAMDLSKFPFDAQTLQIIIEDFNSTADAMYYLPSKQSSTINADLKLSDLHIQNIQAQSLTHKYPFIDTGKIEQSSYSRYVLSIHVERQLHFYITRFFIPLLIILGVAYLAFFIHPASSDARVGMGLTSMLTLIAFAFSVSDLLPRISYPIFIDNIFIMCYFFVLFVIMAVLIETYYDQNGHKERALKIHRFSRPVFLIGFLLATYIIALTSHIV